MPYSKEIQALLDKQLLTEVQVKTMSMHARLALTVPAVLDLVLNNKLTIVQLLGLSSEASSALRSPEFRRLLDSHLLSMEQILGLTQQGYQNVLNPRLLNLVRNQQLTMGGLLSMSFHAAFESYSASFFSNAQAMDMAAALDDVVVRLDQGVVPQ